MTPYTHKKINEYFYLIVELKDTKKPSIMPLLIGNDRAALIDSGLGSGNLRAYVKTLTNKPVIVLNTQGNMDHIGANGLFDTCYLNLKDESLAKLSMSRTKRMQYCQYLMDDVKKFDDLKQSFLPAQTFRRVDVKDGDIIDLGDYEIEAVEVPGRSMGSMAYISRREGAVFVGDFLAPQVQLFFESSTTLREYQATLDEFEIRTKGIEQIYGGHTAEVQSRDCIARVRDCIESVLNGEQGTVCNTLEGRAYIYTKAGYSVFYNPDKIA